MMLYFAALIMFQLQLPFMTSQQYIDLYGDERTMQIWKHEHVQL